VATAAFFLLVATWMEELALFGFRLPGLIGIGALVCAAVSVAGYRRAYEARANPRAALAALARTTRNAHAPAYQPVRLVR